MEKFWMFEECMGKSRDIKKRQGKTPRLMLSIWLQRSIRKDSPQCLENKEEEEEQEERNPEAREFLRLPKMDKHLQHAFNGRNLLRLLLKLSVSLCVCHSLLLCLSLSSSLLLAFILAPTTISSTSRKRRRKSMKDYLHHLYRRTHLDLSTTFLLESSFSLSRSFSICLSLSLSPSQSLSICMPGYIAGYTCIREQPSASLSSSLPLCISLFIRIPIQSYQSIYIYIYVCRRCTRV